MQHERTFGDPLIGLPQAAAFERGLTYHDVEDVLQKLISHRRRRAAYFAASLFADPAWEILLVLALAETRQQRLSVTQLCDRIDVPMTTALRWVGTLADKGLLIRRNDVNDKRRKFIELSPAASVAMAAYCTANCAPMALAA